MDAHRMTNPADIARFITAGRAYFTLRSAKTGTRFTFKAKQPKDKSPVQFISVLEGHDYLYAGMIKGGRFTRTAKSKVAADTPSFRALDWSIQNIMAGHVPATLEFWHEGRCACCGRRLTDPTSIARGIGPECIKKFDGRG